MRARSLLAPALLLTALAAADALSDLPILRQAMKERGPRADEAKAQGARVELTAGGRSFHVLWLPEKSDPLNPPPLIVTLHGHDGWAFEAFHLWHPAAQERGFGILAIQWWLGKGEAPEDYLTPEEVYRDVDETLKRLHCRSGQVLFHGFSRGAANTYPVAALDRAAKGAHWFSLVVSDAGKANLDYPPVRDIDKGVYGPKPFEGLHWVTYAGGKDTNPQRDGIEGMRETADWIRKLGGTVDKALEDPASGHGGFHQNPKNCQAALDAFQARLKAK